MKAVMKNVLQAAVTHQAVCSVKLRHEPSTRRLHPYGLLQNPGGKHMLICWQEEGHSASQKLPNFRTLPIDEVSSLEITTDSFEIHQKFNPTSKMYKGWEFHLKK